MARPNILLIHSDQHRYDVDDWTWDDWAPIVSRYRGEISLLDVQIGWVLDALERLDLTKRTLVIYTTDHGDMCGGHGMIDKHFICEAASAEVPDTFRGRSLLPVMRNEKHGRRASQ